MKRVAIYTFFLTLILVVLVKPGSVTYRVAQANTRKYVAPVAQGAGDCSSWANACTLNTAVSTGWTELWIKAGRYLYTPSTTARCLINAYGGFAGWETNLNQRDLRNNLTIMTGDIGNDDITDANGIVLDYNDIRGTNFTMNCSVSPTTSITVADGIVFTGYIGGTTGRAIYRSSTYGITFRNVVFSGIDGTSINFSSDYGSLYIENAVFRGMKIGLSITRVPAGEWVTVRNALFHGNRNTEHQAGGLLSIERITLENSIFINNVATLVDYYDTAGGARINATAQYVLPVIRNNVFINNTGTQVGGLHVNYTGFASPPYTQGVYLENNIMANNTSTRQAGVGIYANDILAGTNTTYQFANYKNNLIKSSADCTPYPNIYSPQRGNLCGVDPQLGSLQNNGGFIDTVSPLPGSPAIDAGLNNGLSPDARGVARPQDGNNDGIAAYDIGAVEYVPDTTPPTVSSITRLDTSPTNASTARFQVTFSENVKNVDVNDFALTVTGLTGTGIASVSGSGATYTVTVNTGSGNGTIRLDVPSGATIQDMANNNLTDLPYTNGEVYDVDRTAPTVSSITRLGSSPTNANQVQYAVAFSESVTGVSVADFSLTVSGISGASIASVSGSGSNYTVTVNTGSGNGTIRLDIPANATINDLAGNSLSGLPYTNGEVYEVDKTAPSVISITRDDPSPTNASSVTYNVVFSENVTGVSASDFALTLTGTLSGASVTSVNGSGSSYTVTVNTGTGTGTLRLDIPASATISDMVGNNLVGIPYTGGELYSIDRIAPLVVSVTRLGASPTNASQVLFRVVFSEEVIGVTIGDFALHTTGTITGAYVVSVSGSGTTYTVTVNTGSGSGTIRLDVVN